MREELQVARARGKITTGDVDTKTEDYRASGKFFKRMQDEIQQSIAEEGESLNERQHKKQKVGAGNRSSQYKL